MACKPLMLLGPAAAWQVRDGKLFVNGVHINYKPGAIRQPIFTKRVVAVEGDTVEVSHFHTKHG